MIQDTITDIQLDDNGKIISIKGQGSPKDFKRVETYGRRQH